MYTNAENMVKIGPVVVDIFGGICQFLSCRSEKVQLLLSQSLGLLDRSWSNLHTM